MIDEQDIPDRPRGLMMGEFIVIGMLVAWLIAAAVMVDSEPYDGFDVICNSRCMLGLSDQYIFVRMPLMSLLMAPAEYIKQSRGMDPLEVGPHHVTMAILHGIYLIAVYIGVTRISGRRWATLVAFAIAVPNFVFFSYAPFIRDDILPGALLLWMLILADRLRRGEGGWKTWALLVAIGAAGPLIKYTFAVFWVIVLLVCAALALPRVGGTERTSVRKLLILFGGSVCSACLFWIVSGLVLALWMPDRNFLVRPALQLQEYLQQAQVQGAPLWVYARNVWAYGILAMLLVVPGLVSLRRGSPGRTIAIAWLLGLAAMQCVAMREVRYLAFMAPLTAIVIAPVIELLMRMRWPVFVMVPVFCVDLFLVVPEAMNITSPFYRDSEMKQLVSALDETPRPFYSNAQYLNFRAPIDTPFAGDVYHRVFHLGLGHIRTLYGYGANDVYFTQKDGLPQVLMDCPDHTPLIDSIGFTSNKLTWNRPTSNPIARYTRVGLAQTVELNGNPSDGFQWDNEKFDVRNVNLGGRPGVVIGSEVLRKPVGRSGNGQIGMWLSPVAIIDGRAYPMRSVKDTYYEVVGLARLPEKTGSIRLRGFAVQPLYHTYQVYRDGE